MPDIPRPDFKLIGGRLCLDFVNTVGGRTGDPAARRGHGHGDLIVKDRLGSYDALLRWGAVAGTLREREARVLAREAASRPAMAGAVFRRSVALREAVYRVFRSAIQGRSAAPEDLAILNRELHVARAHERVVAAAGFDYQWDYNRALDRVLWPVVSDAAELLTGADLERVRQCPGEQCGWLFFDASRSRRRQWCDMSDCGNLAKVRRFRRRHRSVTRARVSNNRIDAPRRRP